MTFNESLETATDQLVDNMLTNLSVLLNTGTSREDVEDEEYIFDRYSVRVTFIVLYTIVFILCVLGNLVVLLVVTLHWQMRHITKFCMANLAFADFCVGVFCVYQNLSTYLISSWIMGEFLCKMHQFINGLSHTASILTLMVVAVERYLAIVHPLHCRRIMTKNRIRIVVATVWIASGLYCSPRLYYMVTLQVPSWDGLEKEIICTARRTLYDSRTFDMINSVLLFLLPLILMVVLYFRMGLVLRRSAGNHLQCPVPSISITNSSGDAVSESDSESQLRSVNELESISVQDPRQNINTVDSPQYPDFIRCPDQQQEIPDEIEESSSTTRKKSILRSIRNFPMLKLIPIAAWRNKQQRSEEERRKASTEVLRFRYRTNREDVQSRNSIVKMMVVIVVVFALCNLPYHLRKIAVYWWPNFDLGSVYNTLALPVTHLCMYFNCAVNPIIYAFMSSSFRASLKDLVFCRWKRPRIQNTNNSVVFSRERCNSRLVRAERNVY